MINAMNSSIINSLLGLGAVAVGSMFGLSCDRFG